eukprot:gene110-992_t
MVLYFVGLGLGDVKDVTIRGKEAIEDSEYVYLEAYTSVLGVPKSDLEEFYKKEMIEADRNLVESGCDEMLERAKKSAVSFLVVGDALCATTHTDLFLRAKQLGVRCEVIHNASIMNAVAACGLMLYRFGETVSIPYFWKSWKPASFYHKIRNNLDMNLHTLCLLDIKVKEQTEENMMLGRDIYEPPRFMTVAQALDQLFELEDEQQKKVLLADTSVVGVARVGQKDQKIVAGKASEVREMDMGAPLHSLVICAPEIHEVEQQCLDSWAEEASSADN